VFPRVPVQKEADVLSRLLTVEEVADYLGQHRVTVYTEIREGRIPAVRIGEGRTIRVREADLERYLETRSTKVGDAS
jgi:excisionase family DNA binding protein